MTKQTSKIFEADGYAIEPCIERGTVIVQLLDDKGEVRAQAHIEIDHVWERLITKLRVTAVDVAAERLVAAGLVETDGCGRYRAK